MSDDHLPRVAWLVGGHPYDRESLTELTRSLPARIDMHEWPTAEELFDVSGENRLLSEYDVLVLYDMPGVGLSRGTTPRPEPIPASIVDGWKTMTTAGMPILGLHHSVASWPLWSEYAEILKARFHYVPARLRQTDFPDSGYAMNVHQTFTVRQPDHPVCEGLPRSFSLTDETYLCPVFEDEVEILATTDAPRDASFHSSSLAAVRRESNPQWSHPAASPAVVWTHRYRASTVVYVQPGDGPDAFENVWYRRILANAIVWLAGFSVARSSGG